MLGPHRREVDQAAGARVLRGQDVVVQRALVVVDVLQLRPVGVEQPGQLQHVVGVAGLRALHFGDHRSEVVGRVEMLAHAVAAGRDGAVLNDCLPEEFGRGAPLRVVIDLRDPFVPDDLRDLRVGVQAGQVVLALQQRIQDQPVGKAPCQLQIALVAGDGGDVGEHFVHAAVLGDQHLLDLRVAQVRHETSGPVRPGDQHVARLLAAGVEPGIAQAGENLVQVVPGHPGAVQAEQLGLDLSVGDLLPDLLTVRHAAEVTVAVGILRALQFGQHVVQPLADVFPSGGGPGQAQRGQVMPADVAVEAGAFPVAIRFGARRQPGFAQIGRQQAVDVHRHDVSEVPLLRVFERAGEQADLLQRKVLHGRGLGAAAEQQGQNEQAGCHHFHYAGFLPIFRTGK